jgi:hypothetical protein
MTISLFVPWALLLVLASPGWGQTSSAVGMKTADIRLSGPPTSAEQVEAQTAFIRFANALVNGSTQELKDLMGGRLLEKQQALLENPTYPDFLRAHYATAQFQVLGFRTVQENAVEVEADVILHEDESSKIALLLVKRSSGSGQPARFYVHDEVEITE